MSDNGEQTVIVFNPEALQLSGPDEHVSDERGREIPGDILQHLEPGMVIYVW